MILTITDDHGGTVEIDRPGIVTCDSVVMDIIRPALLALGYHPDTVNESLGLEGDDDPS